MKVQVVRSEQQVITEQTIAVTPARYITGKLFTAITGHTWKACQHYRLRGVWPEGEVWKRCEGGIIYDLDGYYSWVKRQ